jgi:hypothetical protein
MLPVEIEPRVYRTGEAMFYASRLARLFDAGDPDILVQCRYYGLSGRRNVGAGLLLEGLFETRLPVIEHGKLVEINLNSEMVLVRRTVAEAQLAKQEPRRPEPPGGNSDDTKVYPPPRQMLRYL